MSRKSYRMIGKEFGNLLVVSKIENSNPRNKKFNVICLNCNREFIAFGGNIRKHAKTDIMGCVACCRPEPKNPIFHKKHGCWNDPRYGTWVGMIWRCYHKEHKAYDNYGGRGISVCDEWKNTPQKFIEWCIENGWKKGLEIDRRNNDGDYCPDNCRIVTRIKNANNRRNNVFVICFGEKLTLAQLARKYNLRYSTVKERNARGWPGDDLAKAVS